MLSGLRNVICGLNIVFELYGHIIPKEEWMILNSHTHIEEGVQMWRGKEVPIAWSWGHAIGELTLSWKRGPCIITRIV